MAKGYQEREKQGFDRMWVGEYVDTRGKLSYCLRCSGKDPNSQKNKVYVKTYKVPSEIKSKKDLNAFRLKIQMEFEQEVENKSNGTMAVEKTKKNVLFKEFANEWVEEILTLRNLSHNYYLACKDRVKVMELFFGNIQICRINSLLIKEFCKWLNERNYKREIATVKESLKPLIKQRKITLVKISLDTGLCDTTVREVFKIDNRISADTATKLAKYLDVPVKKYFDLKTVDVTYSKNTNLSTRNTLYNILGDAADIDLIDSKAVKRDRKNKITGTRSNKEIYNDDEIKQFMQAIKNETDIRKQVAFSIYINIGLRNSELAGLEWKDINFDTGEISIVRNCLYVGSKFKTITKDTKTKNSNRTILMPDSLIDLLRQYKEHWDEQKINHGDLWKRTDRLFCQDNGKDMVGSTPAGWLKDFEKRNGLKHVTPHGLRHNNITLLIKNGIDVKTVSGRVGHANISTTLDVYSHFTKEGDKQAANKLNELFAV